MSWLHIVSLIAFLPSRSGSDGKIYKPYDCQGWAGSSATDHDSHAHSINLAGGNGINHSRQAR